jgi:hypothetical protein
MRAAAGASDVSGTERAAWRGWPAVLATLVLWGCAAPGTVLQQPPVRPGDAAFLTVPERDHVWVIPSKNKNQREIAVTAEGLWVTEGWFTVEYQCYFPKHHPDHAVLAGTPGKAMYFQAGHRYGLKCDDDKAGVIDLLELGSTDAGKGG